MSFSKQVVEQALIACGRHCCLCHKFCGTKIETHHIVPTSEGGDNTFDNCIPLCFDCHSEVESYNHNHPRGRRFRPAELKAHRDRWYRIVKESPLLRQENESYSVTQTIEGKSNIVAGRDVNINRKEYKKNIIQYDPGGKHISNEEAKKILDLKNKYVQLQKEAGLTITPWRLFTKLYNYFGVSSYKEIPNGKAQEAFNLINKEIGSLRPKIRRRNPDLWKKQFYNSIWALARELNLTKDEVYEIAYLKLNLRKRIYSLKELTQQNLQKLDRILKSIKSN